MNTDCLFTTTNNSKLLLILTGWSTGPDLYKPLLSSIPKDWDVIVLSNFDYSESFETPDKYSTVYLLAWSFGVAAAERLVSGNVTMAFAVNGSPFPVDDNLGIPRNIFDGTLENLNLRNLKKFHRRMVESMEDLNHLQPLLSSSPDIEKLKEELQFFNSLSLNSAEYTPKLPWKRVFIAENDRIIPSGNQINAWESLSVSPEIVKLPGGHYPDFLNLLKSIIPDTKAVGNHFSASLNSYDDSASAQKIIVDKLSTLLVNFIQTEKIRESELKVLEIGPGSGLFTKKWGKIITDAEATFIDLYPLPRYNVTKKERYVEQDAEEWLKYSSETFDIILSASTIQWFADPVGFIRQAFHHLNPGGLLLVSTFLPGNLGELDGIRPAPVIYHTHAEFERLCQGLSQEYLLDKEKIEVYFKSPRHALHHLRQTGVGHSPVKIKSRYEIEEALRLPDGSARLTFFPLYIAIKK